MSSNRPKDKPVRPTPRWLKALGRRELPDGIVCNGVAYRRVTVFKHDFFAATGLYEGPAGRVVYKVGRVADLFGLPMAWLGAWLCRREAEAYRRVADIQGVPSFLGRCGPTGFVHEFAPGHVLQRGERVGEEFFPQLAELLDRIHVLDMAYVDLEKRENILVGDDGRPRLIDFQISWHWPAKWGGRSSPARWVLRRFQDSDRYHLLKHWRRHRPDQLSPEEMERSRSKPLSIRLHQRVARPLTRLRRRALRSLDPDRAGRT